MVYNGDNSDPAMRYEALARAAFNNCGKYGDPWNYAAQDLYNHEFVREVTFSGKRALATVLVKLVIDYSGSDMEEKLKILEDRVWEAASQEQIISIIDEAIELLNER